jgi:hypothetical protein
VVGGSLRGLRGVTPGRRCSRYHPIFGLAEIVIDSGHVPLSVLNPGSKERSEKQSFLSCFPAKPVLLGRIGRYCVLSFFQLIPIFLLKVNYLECPPDMRLCLTDMHLCLTDMRLCLTDTQHFRKPTSESLYREVGNDGISQQN